MLVARAVLVPWLLTRCGASTELDAKSFGAAAGPTGTWVLPAPGFVSTMAVLPGGGLAAALGNYMGLPSCNVSVWDSASALQNGAPPVVNLTSSQGQYTQIRCLLNLPGGGLVTGGQTNTRAGSLDFWSTPLQGGEPRNVPMSRAVTTMMLLSNGTLVVAGGPGTSSFVAFFDPPFTGPSTTLAFASPSVYINVQAMVQLSDGAVVLGMNPSGNGGSSAKILWWPSAEAFRGGSSAVEIVMPLPYQFLTTVSNVARVQTLLPLPGGGLAALGTNRQSISYTAAVCVWGSTQDLQGAIPGTTTQTQCNGCTFFSIMQLSSGAVALGGVAERGSIGSVTDLAFVYVWATPQDLISNQAPKSIALNSESVRLAALSLAALPGGLLAVGTFNYGPQPPAYSGSVVVFDPLATSTSTTGTSTTETTTTTSTWTETVTSSTSSTQTTRTSTSTTSVSTTSSSSGTQQVGGGSNAGLAFALAATAVVLLGGAGAALYFMNRGQAPAAAEENIELPAARAAGG